MIDNENDKALEDENKDINAIYDQIEQNKKK